MTVACLIVLLSLAAASRQVLDAFQYADSAAARRVWVARAGTPAVTVGRQGDRPIVQFTAPFGSQQELARTVLDRKVDLDLAAPGEFTLEMAADRPEGAGRVTLYFHSPGGWYASTARLGRQGWQTLRFPKASFRTEDRPSGWRQVDGIRIAVWRGEAVDCTLRLGRLAALWHDVALIVPSARPRPGDREAESARRVAEDFAGMLAELGIESDTIEESAVGHAALGKRAVAVLAYNPRLEDEAAAALLRFVERGGKLFACYRLPPRLARALGIRRFRYVKPEGLGGLAGIRFEASDIPGLPRSVRQASWNINVPLPLGPESRLLGQWYDDRGNATGHAALLLSDKGVYFSHILLTDDRAGKKQLLAALFGRLHPPLWPQMARAELDRIGRVGHLDTVSAVARHVKASGKAPAVERLEAALEAQRAAAKRLEQRGFPEAIELARRSRDLLVEAYLRSAPSRLSEGRAFWNHSGTGAYPGDWQRTAKELAEAGFNMVLPNMLWAGRAHYASDVLPRSTVYQQYGDQIAQCVAAARKYGLEVHVWKVNHNLSGAPPEFVEKLRQQKRLQMSNRGEPRNWLCPSHPDNFQLELQSMIEVVRKYDVDGIHFDYIRYPDRHHCYCEGCRRRFETETGVTVAHWPEDCYSGPLHDRYCDWRCAQITRLVAAVYREAGKIKPGIKISAAVFRDYPQCRESVGQDWVAWVKAGYLDFVCPMDYTQSDSSFRDVVRKQLDLVGGRIPVYPGIGAWRLTPDRVVGQIHLARSLGAAGFTLFNLQPEAAQSLVPSIALGVGSQPAIPPHRRK